jgi:hypothetical protein
MTKEYGSIALLDEEAEIPTIYDRICDTDCPKGDGLCKIPGNASGAHDGPHVCNTCGNTWN